MTNNTMNLMDLVAQQEETRRTGRKDNFTEYGSKKKLFKAEVLTEEQTQVIKDLKGTFTFHLHDDGQYLIITMYDRRRPQGEKYWFLIVDLDTMAVTEGQSIKLSKQTVNKWVGSTEEQEIEPIARSEQEEQVDEVTNNEEEQEEVSEYEKMTVKELKEAMKLRNLKVVKDMVKEDLISTLQANDEEVNK